MASIYSSPAWAQARARALRRDADRCVVARLLGGECSTSLHVHHLDRHGDPYDVDNLLTVCSRHHPRLEAIRRAILAGRPARRRCPHSHPYPEGRRLCEERLNQAA